MDNQADAPGRIYAIAPAWILVAVGFAASLINQKTEMALLCLLVLLVVALAWGWSRRLRSRLSFQTGTDRQRVFPGETFGMEMTVENGNFLPAWVQASPPFENTMTVEEGDGGGSLNTALRWHEAAHFRWRLTAGRRGVYRIGPRQVRVGDLLGFFPFRKQTQTSRELVVFPRLVKVEPPALIKRDFFGAPAPRSPVEDPVYLWGTRDYEPGRPARFIHWRASARHQRWQEKVFEPSAQSKIVLVLAAAGFAEAPDPAGFERAIEVLASLAVAYHGQGLGVRLASDAPWEGGGGERETSANPEAPLVGILERLARLRLKAGRPVLEDLLREPDSLRRANVIFFSRSFDQAAATAASYFRHQSIPATFVISRDDQDDSGHPPAGRDGIRLIKEICPEAGA